MESRAASPDCPPAGSSCANVREGRAPAFARIRISSLEDLGNAVYGAGLEVTQLSRQPVTGSLTVAADDGLLFSSGLIDGRVALRGPLSQSMITLGIGLRIGAGSRHWLNEIQTGAAGAFLPGDEHDAFYTPGSLYATVTLPMERLEQQAARMGLVLDLRTLGGTGISNRLVTPTILGTLRERFMRVHQHPHVLPQSAAAMGHGLLDAVIFHFARLPRPSIGQTDPRGIARVVARARTFIHDRLDEPLSINAIAGAASVSRRTLQRAFHDVLGETVQDYVLKLRLHRIRHDLASDVEAVCTVAVVANRWGISELGRFSGRYRAFFGELPSHTLRSAVRSPDARLAQSA